MLNSRLEKIKSILVCPQCESGLHFTVGNASCHTCTRDYPIQGGKIYFLSWVPSTSDYLDTLKNKLKKRLGVLYYKLGVDLVAPTYPFNFLKQITRYLDPSQQIIIDIGCGNRRLHEDIIGLDFIDYDAVDIVCDLEALPLKRASIDAFVSRSVIEHLKDPKKTVENLKKCTRSAGWSLHLVPFLFPFHASPHDYQRYTKNGVRTLFDGFRVVEQTNPMGPVTLLLICGIEFFSILLSLGNPTVRAWLYLGLCAVLFPLKYLDFFFVNRRSFMTLAPSIFTVFQKET